MNIQYFAEADIKKQESGSLKRAIRKYRKQIEEHNDKILNPSKYIANWANLDLREQVGLQKHWKKEVRNFNQSIQERIDELIKRGDYDGE